MTVKKHSPNPIDLKALVAEDCDWMKSLIKAAVQEVLVKWSLRDGPLRWVWIDVLQSLRILVGRPISE